MRDTLVISVTFDLDRLNDAMGNTRNVTAKEAMMEFLKCAVTEYGLYDGYGVPYDCAPHLEKHVEFSLLEDVL